ncbi:MAG: NAD+ synthase [Alphaproteobacteria bacterium]
MTDLSIFLAQINPIVGDIEGNAAKILATYKQAVTQGADLVVFPELAITGYPPEDLILRPDFIRAVDKKIQNIIQEINGKTAMLLGAPYAKDGAIYNAALLIENKGVRNVQFKHALPNYAVFDEKRVFTAAPSLPDPLLFKGKKIGLLICEDLWENAVPAHLIAQNCDLFLSINASPFNRDKQGERLALAQNCVKKTGAAFYYVNQVGGQDDLVFDGDSFILNAQGSLVTRAPSFEEALLSIETKAAPSEIEDEKCFKALSLGLKDYVQKNGFSSVILGLSGGIDSALVAVLATHALGAENVKTVMMPSPYTAQESLDAAAQLAQNLQVIHDVIPITEMMKGFENALNPFFEGQPEDITEENLQSRIRGVLLMARSNKAGHLVLACGNKSEMATGYATLYGDMCGGYAPIKDLYKRDVFALSNWINRDTEVIPSFIITRPPSAELRPDQKDTDSLPDYDVLDDILHGLIEEDLSSTELIAKGFKEADVSRVYRLLFRNEYKRAQSPPGTKISTRAFTRERRYPLTNGLNW